MKPSGVFRVVARIASLFFVQTILISMQPAMAEEQASCDKPGLSLEPIQGTHSLAPYPKEAQRRNDRGTTILSVTIGTDGAAKDIAIMQSNASQVLNNSVIEHIKTHWQWQPPMRDCRPATAQMPIRVVWVLADSPASPSSDFHVTMPLSTYPPGALDKWEGGSSTLLEIETDDQGAVTNGRIIQSSDFLDLDTQALTIVKNSPALMKGQVAGKHVISADWNLPPTNGPSETLIVIGSKVTIFR